MEVPFDLSTVFDSPLIKLDLRALKQLSPRRCWAVPMMIDRMGKLSTEAQKLRRPLTTYEKLVDAEDQMLYLLWERSTTKPKYSNVVGMLKVGRKQLFLRDSNSTEYQLSPVCILDFFVHFDVQRQGHGHRLYDFMLESEGVGAADVAIDKPSNSLLCFLGKHYALQDAIWQNTNYVVFADFFTNCKNQSAKKPDEKATASEQKAAFAVSEKLPVSARNPIVDDLDAFESPRAVHPARQRKVVSMGHQALW